MKAAAHRLMKEAHEDAAQHLMEKKSLPSPMRSVKMEATVNLVCDCNCGQGPTGPTDGPWGPTGGPGRPCDSIIEFQCHSEDKCIPISYLCDNDNDCEDGEDERSMMIFF